MKLSEKLQRRHTKRKKKIRQRLKDSTRQHRIVINRTNKHFYAQIFDSESGQVVLGVSTSGKDFKPEGGTNSIESCKKLAGVLAEKMKAKNISEAVFDRAGFFYHGKVKAFADAVREAGIKI